MPVRILPGSDDAAGIALGKRKAEYLLRERQDDAEFRKTLHRVFFMPNGSKVTINARGGTVYVTAKQMLKDVTEWLAYCTQDSLYLSVYRHAFVNLTVEMPKTIIRPGYTYEAFRAATFAAGRAMRNNIYNARSNHINAIRADLDKEFECGWLLGAVLPNIPEPKAEVPGPYFIVETGRNNWESGWGVEYSVFIGPKESMRGVGTFKYEFISTLGDGNGSSGIRFELDDWPSNITVHFGEYSNFDGLVFSTPEVMDGFLVSGTGHFLPFASGQTYKEDLKFKRLSELKPWLKDKTTFFRYDNSHAGSFGDKAVKTGSIIHVFCLEYLFSDNYFAINPPYWCPSAELATVWDIWSVGIYPFEPYDPEHPDRYYLTAEDEALLGSDITAGPVVATSVRVYKHFAKKLVDKAGGLADREWVNAKPANPIKSKQVLGVFPPLEDLWGLPSWVVVIENPNGDFHPKTSKYADAVTQSYAQKHTYTGTWATSTTVDAVKSMTLSTVLKESGFING